MFQPQQRHGGNNFTTTGASAPLEGSAPVEVRTIRVNGVTVPVTWPAVTTWSINKTLQMGANNITVQAYDRKGKALSGYVDSIVITRQ